MIKTIYFTLLSCLLYSVTVKAQIGIGTTNPLGSFHIDAKQDNNTSSPSKYTDDFIVNNSGNVGLGTMNPIVKLDLRSSTNNNTIGLGNPTDATLSATAAKAGAMKYYYTSSNNKGIKYSNGTQWIARNATQIKSLVFANKSTSQTIASNTNTNLTGWTVSTDRNSNFVSDVFKANREGTYIATLNLAFSNSTITNDSTIEVLLSSNTTLGVPQFRCVYSFPGNTSNSVSNIVTGSCTGVFRLSENNTITPSVIQNIGGTATRTILNDSSYNTLSITEL